MIGIAEEPLLLHLAGVLGPPDACLHLAGSRPSVSIVTSPNPEHPGTRCVMTVGLSTLVGTTFRHSGDPSPGHELAAIVEPPFAGESSSILEALATETLGSKRVIDSYSILARPDRPKEKRLTHLLVVNGSPLPESLGEPEDAAAFVVLWVLPISAAEAAYGESKSAYRLMLQLRWSGVNIFDLARDSIVFPTPMMPDEFKGALASNEDACGALLRRIEADGEDRRHIIEPLANLLRATDDTVRQCASEVTEALALSEPESFTKDQVRSIVAALSDMLASGSAPFGAADVLAAVRHARTHARS